MARRKITILFFPDGSDKIRQVKIPKTLLVILCLLFLSGVGVLSWGIQDYQAVKRRMPRLADLEKENRQQKKQLVVLAQKVDQIGRKMIEVKDFDQKLRTMVNLETGQDDMAFLGIGGSDPSLLNPDYTIEKAHQKLIRLMHKSVENLDIALSDQSDRTLELYNFLKDQKSMLVCTPSIWPTRGWVSSRFGYRTSPFTSKKEFHGGLDIVARVGTPIMAPADGIISSVGRSYGYGKSLAVKHGYGLKTRYAHVSKILVKKGQHVKRGDTIALVGDTGRTTGPHLHYEVHLNGVPVNPSQYILN